MQPHGPVIIADSQEQNPVRTSMATIFAVFSITWGNDAEGVSMAGCYAQAGDPMTRYLITTGMQTVTAAGPVAGTLSTAALNSLKTIYLNVTGLTAGDALPVKVWHFAGAESIDGVTVSASLDEIVNIRKGATGNALRVNVLALGSGASLSLTGTVDA
jgi:hypothetical protein